jgi:NADH-quinone oxidoreductase subunit L
MMLQLLWIIPALPLAGFLILSLAGARMPRQAVAVVGTGSVGLSAAAAVLAAIGLLTGAPPHTFTQTCWGWWQLAGFQPTVTFYLDALAAVMMLVITVVGFLIHLYSTEFMAEDPGFSRFFAYMNLFVGAMLILVLADNLVLLYLGWEGVGLCSYLLIGFWTTDPQNGYAARKAFVVTRIGDTAMLLGLLLLFSQLGTLQIQALMGQARQAWPTGNPYAVATALLLLGGAVGKSAQLPLQTWLPDAMAGPSPVSALIHAATMVTAGVYLIARTHVLFTLAPAVLTLVAVLGALTLLLAGFSALVQKDIKRVLAYSTISQIGYMFLALGVGAWSAAMFHFMVHAFFKALLFLGAGVVIQALDEEHDMFKMGGLRRQLPLTFWTFLIGSAALAAVPLVTAGFYSKDRIIWLVFASPADGRLWLWAAALVGALLTSLYTFRLVFHVFFGPAHTPVSRRPGWPVKTPLVVLAVFSLLAGFIQMPRTLGDTHLFADFLQSALPPPLISAGLEAAEGFVGIISMTVALAGIGAIYLLVLSRPQWADKLRHSKVGAALHDFWFSGWRFDALYNHVVVRPYICLAQLLRDDPVDRFFRLIAGLTRAGHHGLSVTQSGSLRAYAMGIAAGAVLIIAMVVFL